MEPEIMPSRRWWTPPGPLRTWQGGALGLALVVVVVALSLPSTEASITFEEEPVGISRVTKGDQTSVDLAVGPDDRLYAVWEDDRFTTLQAGISILFASSEPDDRGRAFGDAVQIPTEGVNVDQRAPSVSVGPDGVIHVVWQERSRRTDAAEGPFWEVQYSRSRDGGAHWSDPVRVSQPNNRDNSGASVAAVEGDDAYVAWVTPQHPGTSIHLAYMEEGSRSWFREDFVRASDSWEMNGWVDLATDGSGNLHAAWAARNLTAGGDLVTSQVFYLSLGEATGTTVLNAPVAMADEPANRTQWGPSLALTRRHGAWVSWASEPTGDYGTPVVTFMTDRVLEGRAAEDLVVAELSPSSRGGPAVATAGGPSDGVLLALSGVGTPDGPPLYTEACSEHGCFAEPRPVVPEGRGYNASIVADSLGNVYVAWDDGRDLWLTQRSNSPPGAPELLRPDLYTRESRPEFVWGFNDPDAGSSQGAFEIEYARDELLEDQAHHASVTGLEGRVSRYTAPDPLEEGRWYWRVRSRDMLGLWSPWSVVGDFLADRTPPSGSIVIAKGAESTSQRVVTLTLNATDDQEAEGVTLLYQVSNDPNFPNSTTHEWPPPKRQLNHGLSEGEGIKVVFFRVFDATGLSFTAMDTIIYNRTPIGIFHTPVASAPMNKPINVSCEITGPEGITATLNFRKHGEDKTEYRQTLMESNGTSYWAEIPKDMVTLKDVDYYISARLDSVTVTSPATTPEDKPYKVKVYETTEEYQPPIYSPTLTLVGAIIIVGLLLGIWYYRIRGD